MARLTRDVDDRAALGEQERDERVAQVVGASDRDVRIASRNVEHATPPVAIAVICPDLTVAVGEYERVAIAFAELTPDGEIISERGEQSNCSDPARLRLLDLSERDGALDQERAFAHVAPAERECFPGTESGIGEDRDQRGVAEPLAGQQGRSESLDRNWSQ
ncbi:MAG TPA: hypothetical protein VGO31_01185 [Microbacteriaceae bacterium]|nr:hypothetical protein [Microbacteriaceae bacterium]